MIQAIDLDLVYGMQHHAQAALWEALGVHPLEVVDRDIADHGAFVFTVRHGRNNQLF